MKKLIEAQHLELDISFIFLRLATKIPSMVICITDLIIHI